MIKITQVPSFSTWSLSHKSACGHRTLVQCGLDESSRKQCRLRDLLQVSALCRELCLSRSRDRSLNRPLHVAAGGGFEARPSCEPPWQNGPNTAALYCGDLTRRPKSNGAI